MGRNSLRWRLTRHLTVWQGLAIIIFLTGNSLALFYFWYGGELNNVEGIRSVTVVSDALTRDRYGRIHVERTPALDKLMRDMPSLWYVIRDDDGQQISEGQIPRIATPVLAIFDSLGDGSVGHTNSQGFQQLGTMQWVDTKIGRVHILANAQGQTSFSTVLILLHSSISSAAWIVALASLAIVLVTPLVVRGALASLRKIVTEAEAIDIKHLGSRLSTEGVPMEIMPLVKAVNDGLERLDAGYERHKRFLADAAHELRTPITILATRASALKPSEQRSLLLADMKRLNVLAGQLLDVQRLDDQYAPSFSKVDLVLLAERILMELAPAAFSAGYEVDFTSSLDHVLVDGDEGAIQRAITNLVQNAIDHGGGRGLILVHVAMPPSVEVSDQGTGIDAADRDDVFVPFRRLKRGGHGAGLGLNLVQQVMQLHGGFAEVADKAPPGACLRLVFPEPKA